MGSEKNEFSPRLEPGLNCKNSAFVENFEN